MTRKTYERARAEIKNKHMSIDFICIYSPWYKKHIKDTNKSNYCVIRHIEDFQITKSEIHIKWFDTDDGINYKYRITFIPWNQIVRLSYYF